MIRISCAAASSTYALEVWVVGDTILSVDGIDTSALDYNQIANLLLEKKDASRVLKLKR